MLHRRQSQSHAPAPAERAAAGKRPFDIDEVILRVEEAVRPFDKAALFQLAEEGHTTPFEQLMACMISIRTRDETMLAVARRLFAKARTPEAVARLSPEAIDALIRPATYHEPKARQIHAMARRVADELGGALPCTFEALTSFAGVGPKCANLVLAVACGEARIGVDVHVHRITNRWGYVATKSPEATLAALEAKLPRRHWLTMNRVLVPFGKNICVGVRPRCSTCPVLDQCRQVGVTTHR